jgi:hypothetical protein
MTKNFADAGLALAIELPLPTYGCCGKDKPTAPSPLCSCCKHVGLGVEGKKKKSTLSNLLLRSILSYSEISPKDSMRCLGMVAKTERGYIVNDNRNFDIQIVSRTSIHDN